ESGLGHLLDVEDHEPSVPIAHVETIAETHRMVATMVRALPRGHLTARRPLAPHPPAPDLLGEGRGLEAENHNRVAAVAVDLWRPVGITAVEGEAMHAARGPRGDLPRRARARDVVDVVAAWEIRRWRPWRVHLPVHEHHVVLDAHLVRVHAGGNRDLGELARPRRDAHVPHRPPLRRGGVGAVPGPTAGPHPPPPPPDEGTHPPYARGG